MQEATYTTTKKRKQRQEKKRLGKKRKEIKNSRSTHQLAAPAKRFIYLNFLFLDKLVTYCKYE
jgi:hypothetical protein